MIGRFERAMDRWTSAVWASVRKPGKKPMDVVVRLRRECDDNALIMGRGRTVVPNCFSIELPADSHRRLAGHRERLGPELAAEIRRYAAERSDSFAGPVTVGVAAHPDGGRTRYRVHSRLVPCHPPTHMDAPTMALPQVTVPPRKGR
ncbi:FhaA domain-containing protein [Streptomyces ochraceiscleroticus]|uniref:FhaA domain-containing protein n=1 Tax=Streptomyces ochraceiscleroticus TaxID=47761 RepID=A0ABW1MIV6_9ACTN|nr:FhaA domain-containing protein [Streptomyces ochraceiscleroticus]